MVSQCKLVLELGTIIVYNLSLFVYQPGECKIGIMPGHIHKWGKIGKPTGSGSRVLTCFEQFFYLLIIIFSFKS